MAQVYIRGIGIESEDQTRDLYKSKVIVLKTM